MKLELGPIILEAERRKPTLLAAGDDTPKCPPQTERGHAGVARSVMGVYAMAERIDYNSAMAPPARWGNVEKMRKSDGSIKAALLAVTLPLLSVEWRVSPASDDPKDEEIAAFIEDDLKGMSTSWPEYLRELLLYLADGVRPYEPVWELRDDGKIHLRKMAPRPPATVLADGWLTDDHGGPAGIKQLGPDGVEEITIPIEELVVFTHEREGANWLGNSILRAAYKHWWYAEELERIAAIAAERGAVGVPVFEVDPASGAADDDDESSRLDDIGMGLHANERMFVRLPAGVKMTLQGVSGNLVDPLPLIEYHKREALKALLAQFISVGTGDVGSWAAAREHTSFFVMLLDAIAQQVAHVHRRYLFLRWCRWNWDPAMKVDQLPTLEYGKLETRDVGSYLDALVKAIDNKLVPTTRDVRRLAMDHLDLPALSDEEWDALEEEEEARREQMSAMVDGGGNKLPAKDGEDEQGDGDEGAGAEGKAPAQPVKMAAADGEEELPSLGELRRLGIQVDFDGMREALDKSEAGILNAVQAVQDRMIASMVAHARTVIRDNDPSAVSTAQVRFVDEMAEAVERELEALAEVGRRHAEGEIQSQGAEPPEPEKDDENAIGALLAAMALTTSRRLADRLLATWQDSVVGQLDNGFDGDRLREDLRSLADSTIQQRARLMTGRTLNAGRNLALKAAAKAGIVGKEIYTAVMDEYTCRGGPTKCWENDGQVFPVGGGRPAPNPDCDGRERCRCVRVAVIRPEQQWVPR
jgi:phage gp29-like protein